MNKKSILKIEYPIKHIDWRTIDIDVSEFKKDCLVGIDRKHDAVLFNIIHAIDFSEFIYDIHGYDASIEVTIADEEVGDVTFTVTFSEYKDNLDIHIKHSAYDNPITSLEFDYKFVNPEEILNVICYFYRFVNDKLNELIIEMEEED